jgi:hypothetical protein
LKRSNEKKRRKKRSWPIRRKRRKKPKIRMQISTKPQQRD